MASAALFFDAATARTSQRSFSGWLLWPFIHTKFTVCCLYMFRNCIQRSLFFLPLKPVFNQPNTHFFSTESITYFESENTVTCWPGDFNAFNPTITASNSIRLLVVSLKPALISL